MEAANIKEEFETNGPERFVTIQSIKPETDYVLGAEPIISISTEIIWKDEPEISNTEDCERATQVQASTNCNEDSEMATQAHDGTSYYEDSEIATQALAGTSCNKDSGTKKKRKGWDQLNMINAIKTVREGSMGYLAASKLFEVPKNTLEKYVKKKSIDPSILINTPLGRTPISPHEEESSNDKVKKVLKNVKRKTWDKQSMIHAVETVRDGALGCQAASKMFKVPKITLRRYVKNETVEPSVLVNAPLGRKPYLESSKEDSSSKARVNWTKENMIKAVLCVRSGRLGYAKAGKLFKVPYLTLRWYVKNAKIDLSTEKDIPLESMSELTEMMQTKREPAKRKLWDKQSMINAINAVRDGAVGYLAASKMFGVPKVTLRRYAKLKDFDPSELIDKSLGRKPVMSLDLQEKLAKHCIEMDEKFFGLKGVDVLEMADQLAAQNNISTSFTKDSAGRTWLHNFMKKYPDLRSRTNRNAYDKSKKLSFENIPKFLDMYTPIYEKVDRKPHRIFSVDDIGLCVVEDDPETVIRLRGKKEYSTFSDEEKTKLVTSIVCMNASGCFVPPLIVWPTKSITKKVTNHTPPGSIWACHSSGFVTTHIFMMWFDHFIKHTCPSSSNPALLLLEGRKPYVRNIEILDKAKENHVFIVSLPPNSSQLLQPLENSFIKSFKVHYTSETRTYLDSLSDENKMQNTDLIKLARLAKIFSVAYSKAETDQSAENAFEKIGLCPFMPSFFPSPKPSGKRSVIKTEPKTELQDESPMTCET
ncbi:uncharacterized protein [Parasteatoda tepidariorum]|nr:uncharacterized protein LOC107436618 [Parasteatoda tepidariorum]